MRLQTRQEVTRVTETKDKEINQLQEQLQSTYKDLTGEIDQLQTKILEVSNDLCGKDKIISQH